MSDKTAILLGASGKIGRHLVVDLEATHRVIRAGQVLRPWGGLQPQRG